MSYVILSLFILFLVIGILLVPLGLPGTWLIALDAFLYALVRNFDGTTEDWKVVMLVVFLALAGEIIEFGIGIAGAKREKVPNGAIVASIAGGILGAVIGVPVFLIGSVLGLLIGTFVGALIYGLFTSHHLPDAFRIAKAALFSRAIALFAKTAIALGMSVYLLFKLF